MEFTNPTTLPNVGDERAKSWDMKAMIKFIMLSDAYKQRSSASETLFKKDPENRLLSRGPRMRLIGEVIRDQALFVGGLLVPKLGGPSVRPYMPKGVGLRLIVMGISGTIQLTLERVYTVEVCIQYGKELPHLQVCYYLMHPIERFVIQSVQEPIRHYRHLLL